MSPVTEQASSATARLRFEFDPVKLGQALAFLAGAGVTDLTRLKAAKLLYFADKLHLLRYGRPIVGDTYYCLDYGPVPTASLNIINDLINPVQIRLRGKPLESPVRQTVARYVIVTRQGRHPRLEARKPAAGLDALTKSEREALEETANQYGKLPIGKLVELTHQERPWILSNECRKAGSSVEVPWEFFFDEAEHADQLKEHAAEHQANRNFLRALRVAAQE